MAELPAGLSGAPAVVAVVVTKNPGPWFEETLDSLEEQDYESLSVLVVDNGSVEDPTERVAEVAPGAFVKRLRADEGFSEAANEALRSVEGAPFLLLCHDDVRLAPDAVTQLVAEAFRANAGIVAPKLVDWDQPDVLRSIGYTVDSWGVPAEMVDPGELDQSQHDIARPAFAVSDACMLVRSDVLAAVGGFNPRIPFFGEDVDLCWRARVAGANVQFCPQAVAGHIGDFAARRPVDVRGRLELRHQVRSTLANTQLRRLVRIAPVGVLLSVVEFVGSVLTGRGRRMGDVLAAWGWTLLHLPEILRDRRRVQRARRVPDAEFGQLVRNGSLRLRDLATPDGRRRPVAERVRGRRRERTEEAPAVPRLAVGVAVAAVALAVLGARSLPFGTLPSMREFVSAGDSVGSLWSQWWSAWRESGLGESAVPPGVVTALAAASTLLLGSVGAAHRLLILLPVVFAMVGAWRLFSASGSPRARAAALLVYGLSPVALNAMGEARLQALVAWAAAPWVLRHVGVVAGLTPLAAEDRRVLWSVRELARTGLVVALVVAVSPLAGVVVAVGCALVLLGVAVGGGTRPVGRALAHLLVGWVLGMAVALPWLVASALRGDLGSVTGLFGGRASVPSGWDMLAGSVGPVTTGVLGLGVAVAAAVALVTGRDWRFSWALGGWFAVAGSLAAATLAGRADLLAGAGVEVLLVPLALGLSVAVAMGPLAFERDVVSSDFGVRQVLSFVGVLALFLGLVPVALASFEGRWYLPEGDFARSLSVVDDGDDFRVLWVGDPDSLPVAGWELDAVDRVAVGTSVGMDPLMSQRYRLDGGPPVTSLQEAFSAVVEGRTTRLGQLLAPMAIRYVVLVDRPAPEPFAALEVPPPPALRSALAEQVDLATVSFGEGAEVFEVVGAWPPRSDISELELGAGTTPRIEEQLLLPVVEPAEVLPGGYGTAFSGPVEGGAVAQATTPEDGWRLTVDGEAADRSSLFGCCQQFSSGRGGDARLAWTPPLESRALQALQLAVLGALVFLAVRRGNVVVPARGRRIAVDDDPLVVVDGPAPVLGDWAEGAARTGDPDATDPAGDPR